MCAAGVYFVPAFSGLLAPHWRDDARGCLLGLSQYSDRRHIVRAVLEGIAFQVCDVLRAIEADTGQAVDALRVDGGATRNDLLMQLQVRAPAFACMHARHAAAGSWHSNASSLSLSESVVPRRVYHI